MTKNRQVMFGGEGNQQAGNNIYNNVNLTLNDWTSNLKFYEKDIRNVIELFSGRVEYLKTKDLKIFEELNKIPLDNKNKLNKLSEDYFFDIIEDSFFHFPRIDAFLKDKNNEKYLNIYENTVFEIRNKIAACRNDFYEFERVFPILYNYIVENNEELEFDKKYIWIFLHYMYCRCHIGKKERKKERII